MSIRRVAVVAPSEPSNGRRFTGRRNPHRLRGRQRRKRRCSRRSNYRRIPSHRAEPRTFQVGLGNRPGQKPGSTRRRRIAQGCRRTRRMAPFPDWRAAHTFLGPARAGRPWCRSGRRRCCRRLGRQPKPSQEAWPQLPRPQIRRRAGAHPFESAAPLRPSRSPRSVAQIASSCRLQRGPDRGGPYCSTALVSSIAKRVAVGSVYAELAAAKEGVDRWDPVEPAAGALGSRDVGNPIQR
jgi:hypothetical protein